jgi:hypothetical protein
MRSGLALVALALVAACDDSFVKGWRVDRTRVLGARVEAAAEPARASIAPGEPMRVTWLVGAPDGTGRLAWAYALCAPPGGHFPEPHCEGPALAAGSGASEGELAPMDMSAPPADAIGDGQELLLLAAFCEAGPPALDARAFVATCAGGGAPLLASTTVRLAAKGPNRNPELAPDAVLFDGAPIAPSAARPGPCAPGADSPVAIAGSSHGFTFRFRPEDREPVPEGGLETLLASHLVTAGTLDRQYSALEPDDHAPKEVAIPWTAPPVAEVGDGGRLVEVFVVLRDGRGGTALSRRTVCVRRAPR